MDMKIDEAGREIIAFKIDVRPSPQRARESP
jgi:hypothetical protein